MRGERDFRHQEHDPAAGAERDIDRPQVNLGLARTRDAVEQGHAEFLFRELGGEGVGRRLLLGIGRVRLGGDQLALGPVVGIGNALDAAGLLAHEAPLNRGGDRCGREPEAGEDEGFQRAGGIARRETRRASPAPGARFASVADSSGVSRRIRTSDFSCFKLAARRTATGSMASITLSSGAA